MRFNLEKLKKMPLWEWPIWARGFEAELREKQFEYYPVVCIPMLKRFKKEILGE